jgi:hypothetical protein
MATPIFLTPGDAKILAKLIEREKSVPSTTAPRTPLDMQWTEGRQHPPDQGQHRQTVEGFAAGCEFVVAVVRPSAILLVLFVRQRRRSDVRLR